MCDTPTVHPSSKMAGSTISITTSEYIVVDNERFKNELDFILDIHI
jgi:hypothetical protein